LSAEVTPRRFVGVTDTRHAFNVDCFDLLGDKAREVSRDAVVAGPSLVLRVLAFFAGNCEGDGWAGESTKSNVSIVFRRGGVDDRSGTALISAGSVLER